MVFPHVKSKPVYSRLWDGLKGLVGSGDKKADIHVPSHDSMQKKCLEMYLETHKKMLCGCNLSPKLNILQAMNGINLIFNQLYNQKVINSGGFTRDWKSDALVEV